LPFAGLNIYHSIIISSTNAIIKNVGIFAVVALDVALLIHIFVMNATKIQQWQLIKEVNAWVSYFSLFIFDS
jgi:hypothetical protein